MPERPTQVWVRWPGGQATISEVPETAEAISIDSSGRLDVIR